VRQVDKGYTRGGVVRIDFKPIDIKRSKYEWLWEWLGAISIVALVWFLVLF